MAKPEPKPLPDRPRFNEATKRAIRDARAGRNVTRYASVDAMFAALGIAETEGEPNGAAEHEFTVALKGEWDEVTDEMADRLYEAGCDDAAIVIRGGRVFLAFTRQAESMADAQLTAIGDIRRAGYEIA